jgi:hypothetical protein
MHGLIFVTWEKYLNERFGTLFLHHYREKIGEKVTDRPLANRMYDDETLLAGVGAASGLSQLPAETLLREYGRYFIANGLTGHLCAYILSNVHSSRDLLLAMRDAHARLRRTLDGMVPPLFEYGKPSAPNEIVILYDSDRHLCDVLLGAVEGAAQRYGETVQVQEPSCMKRGDAVCRIVARFTPPTSDPERYRDPARQSQKAAQAFLMKEIWNILPEAGTIDGFTLPEITERLRRYNKVEAALLRPAIMIEALYQMQFSGYATSTSSEPGDTLMGRRYWRVHRHM